MAEGVKSELQLQIEATKIRQIRGQPVKIPDLSQWEKVTKYMEKKNLTKIPREDMDRILLTLWPYHQTISKLEIVQQDEIDSLAKELKYLKVRQREEAEEALDVREFFTRELQEKEEDITTLRREYEDFKHKQAHDHGLELAALEEQLEQAKAETEFMQREVEYAEAKLAGLGDAASNQAEEAALAELAGLRQEKLNFQKELRTAKQELKSMEQSLKELSSKNMTLGDERDAAIEEAETVKDTIKDELAQLEEDVSRELAGKEQELMDANERYEELQRHSERMEQKLQFLIKENAELEAREDVVNGGITPRTPRTGRSGGGNTARGNTAAMDLLQQEQLEFAQDKIRGLEERNAAMKETVEEAQNEANEKVAELRGQIAQIYADQEELVEKGAQADQLRDWLEQVSLERDEDRMAADAELAKLKGSFHTEKAIAIEHAVEDMKNRNADMEIRVEESDELRMQAEEQLELAVVEIEALKNDLENLEVESSYLKVQGRMGAGGDSRETEALKKQILTFQAQRDQALADAEALIQKERIKNSEKIHSLEAKFNAQLEEEAEQQVRAKGDLKKRVSELDADKAKIVAINLAFGKQLREKEMSINDLEYSLSELKKELRTATEDVIVLEEQKESLEKEVLELLEMQENDNNDWKENVEVIKMNQELERLQTEIEGLEDQHLEDMEELSVEKDAEYATMKAQLEKEIEQKEAELVLLVEEQEAELGNQNNINASGQKARALKAFALEIYSHCLRSSLSWWKKNTQESTLAAVTAQLATTEEALAHIRKLGKEELRAEVQQELEEAEDRIMNLEDSLKTQQERANAQVDRERKATQNAQAQLLFITGMTQKQLKQANRASSSTRIARLWMDYLQRNQSSYFSRWKDLLRARAARVAGTTERSDQVPKGPMAPDAANILANIRYRDQLLVNQDSLVLDQLHTQMCMVTRLCSLQSQVKDAVVAQERGASVHELELNAKRQGEKQWYLEKQHLQGELEAMKRKSDVELGLFNQIQGALHAEKLGLAEQLDMKTLELTEMRHALENARNEGAQEIIIAREAQLTVAYKTGIWKLIWILGQRNQAAATALLRNWSSAVLDSKWQTIATTKQEHNMLKEQFEMSQHQYTVHTMALRENLRLLSMTRAFDKIEVVLRRRASQSVASNLACWTANKVRYDATFTTQTQAQLMVEQQQRQMGLKNQELWVNLKDTKERQLQIGLKTLLSILLRRNVVSVRNTVSTWKALVLQDRQLRQAQSIAQTEKQGVVKVTFTKLDNVMQARFLIRVQQVLLRWRVSLADFKFEVAKAADQDLSTEGKPRDQQADYLSGKLKEAADTTRTVMQSTKASSESDKEKIHQGDAHLKGTSKSRNDAQREHVEANPGEAAAVFGAIEASSVTSAESSVAAEIAESSERNDNTLLEIAEDHGEATMIATATETPAEIPEDARAPAALTDNAIEAQSEIPDPHSENAEPTKENEIQDIAFMNEGELREEAQGEKPSESTAITDAGPHTHEGMEVARTHTSPADKVTSVDPRAEVSVTKSSETLPESTNSARAHPIEPSVALITVPGLKNTELKKSVFSGEYRPESDADSEKENRGDAGLTPVHQLADKDSGSQQQAPTEDIDSRETAFHRSSQEILLLLQKLNESENELREQLIDGHELEVEYQRLENMLNPQEDAAIEARPVTLPPVVLESQQIIRKMDNASNMLTNFEFNLIVSALKDAEDAISEKRIDNQSLECEIERLESELEF